MLTESWLGEVDGVRETIPCGLPSIVRSGHCVRHLRGRIGAEWYRARLSSSQREGFGRANRAGSGLVNFVPDDGEEQVVEAKDVAWLEPLK